MTQKDTVEREGFPRWAYGVAGSVFAALVVGAITQSVMLYAQIQVTNERLALQATTLEKIEKRLDAVQAGSANRWTSSDQNVFAAAVEGKIGALRADLRAHVKEPWHVQAGAEHAETKRRVDRLERDVRELQQALAELKKR